MAFLLGKSTEDTEDLKIIPLVQNSCPILLQSENETPKRQHLLEAPPLRLWI
jgi:hypothetical protein